MKTAWWLNVLLLLIRVGNVSAQMITIPDPNFLIFLQNSDVAGCLSGNQLNASCAGVVNKTELYCNNSNINDLTGIEAFVNLQILDCSGNDLTGLPTLPLGLTSLSVSTNPITSLPALPSTLNELYCNYTFLTTLPTTLPDSLNVLFCYGNSFTNLPELPSSLNVLNCQLNELASLPTLPLSLTELNCQNNELNSLPTLPNFLTKLVCGGNQLSNIPVLPSTLSFFACGDNQLISLPELPNTLSVLECQTNLLNDLPILPDSLQTFYCWENQLTYLPPLPLGMASFYCYSNQLTSIPPLPASLVLFSCSNNQLASLPSLPNSLIQLMCSYNQLTSLPSLPPVMYRLNVDNNPSLNCLPSIEKITGTNYFSFNIANTNITCLPNVIQHSGTLLAIDTVPICDAFNVNDCQLGWNINGDVYHDDNTNCSGDSAEPHLHNIKLKLLQGGNIQQQIYSNITGLFSFNTDLGTYETCVDTTGLPFNVTCPANNSYTSNLTSMDSLDYNADFALQCKPGYDVAVQSICHWGGMFFPVHQATVSIQAGDLVQYYGTTCNTTGLSGTVTATYSGPATVASVSGNGLVAGNTITWNVSDFSQLDFFNDFSITFSTDTFPPQGSQVCIDVNITANTGADDNLSNNTLTQCFNVVNSFDPNFKEVYPATISQPGGWHTYTVHFQNTGTAAAQHIQVKDTLDANLDWSSFQLLAYSHNNLTQVLNNGIVHFNFPNINLPDSTSDEPNSHGWIQYRIKTEQTIQAPITIHNSASIYFDFNSPIITNDAVIEGFCTDQTVVQNLWICDGDSLQVGNNWYHQAAVYTDQLITALGCDSTVVTDLSVLPSSSFNQTITVCVGESISVGDSVYNTSGAYVNNFQNVAGCDSIVTTNLIVDQLNTAVTLNAATLTAATGLTYQWINCDNNQNISGATSQLYTATQNGNYQVQVTDANGCSALSSCFNVIVVNVETFADVDFELYPNPAQNSVVMSYTGNIQNAQLQLTDLSGRIILTKPLQNAQTILPLDDLASGSYVVRLLKTGKTVGTKNLTLIK